MEQVPAYAIIGGGRVARHFGRYLELKGVGYKQWSRGGGNLLKAMVDGVRCVFILISDSAIEGFVREHGEILGDRRLVHFSGALDIEGIVGVHPLMTFGDNLYSKSEYEGIPFIHTEGEPSLRELVPELRNSCYAIKREDRGYYHALAAAGGNFTQILWEWVLKRFEERLGLGKEVIKPYMRRVMENAGTGQVTGPLVRGDAEVVEKHLEVFEGDGLKGIYEAFVENFKKEGI